MATAVKKTIKVEVSQETVNYVQRIDLEANSRKVLLEDIARQLGVKTKAFRDYHEEYMEFDAEYQLIKNQIQETYIPEELRTKHELTWQLDFSTNLLIIDITCQCGIDLANSGTLDWTPKTDTVVEASTTRIANAEYTAEYETKSCNCGSSDGCACGK